MRLVQSISHTKIFRILWSLWISTFFSIWRNKDILTSKSWVFQANQSPFPLLAFASTEFTYPSWLMRIMFRRNRQSYWINTTSSVIGFNKNLTRLWDLVLSKNHCPYVLILSDGDVTVSIITSPILKTIAEHPQCRRIYAQNLLSSGGNQTINVKLRPIPIGLDLHTYRRGLNPKSLASYLTHSIDSVPEKTVSAVMDFQASLFSPIRAEILEMTKNLCFFQRLPRRLEQVELWELYKRAKIVISPKGGGLDCHRTWEGLWFGCIVVVVADGLEHLFANVPNIVYISDISILFETDLLENLCERAKSVPSFQVSVRDFILAEDLQFLN